MRKAIASELVSLDGVVESPETWHLQYFNDQMAEAIGAAMAASDAMLLGRVTAAAGRLEDLQHRRALSQLPASTKLKPKEGWDASFWLFSCSIHPRSKKGCSPKVRLSPGQAPVNVPG